MTAPLENAILQHSLSFEVNRQREVGGELGGVGGNVCEKRK